MHKKLKGLKLDQDVMKYLINTTWMFAEVGLKIISGIFVGIYVARYLGAEGFGLFSYGLSFVTIFMAISRLGMDSILVRELVNHPHERPVYMGTAFALMLASSIIAFVFVVGLISLIESDFSTKLFVWVIASSLLFQAFFVIDFNFQAQVLAKYSSVAKSIGMVLGSIIKVSLVFLQSDLLFFAIAYVFDAFLVTLFLILAHLKCRQPNFMFRARMNLVRPLLKSAWPMFISGAAGILLMRIDQLMIKGLLGVEHLGQYAAASMIYEGWITLFFVLTISLLPAIAKLKNGSRVIYEKSFIQLFGVAFWLCVLCAIFITFFGRQLIILTFGTEFMLASTVLTILIWTSALSVLGFLSSRYLVVEKMEPKVAKRNWTAVVINIPLNFVLIPTYGIEGAATATFISFFLVHYVMDWLDPDLKTLLYIKNSALVILFRRKSK